MADLLLCVYLNGDKERPAQGQPLRPGISGVCALKILESTNGPGNLRDSTGVFISDAETTLQAGDYAFIPAGSPGMLKILFMSPRF